MDLAPEPLGERLPQAKGLGLTNLDERTSFTFSTLVTRCGELGPDQKLAGSTDNLVGKCPQGIIAKHILPPPLLPIEKCPRYDRSPKNRFEAQGLSTQLHLIGPVRLRSAAFEFHWHDPAIGMEFDDVTHAVNSANGVLHREGAHDSLARLSL
jgi:hypothetical protein